MNISDKHVMIDIETLDTTPTAHILSIGAVPFTFGGSVGEGIHIRMAPTDQRGRTVSIRTVQWWMAQSAAAREAAFGAGLGLSDGLRNLAHWIHSEKPVGVWSHGPQFDLVILRNAFESYSIQCPWHYRIERDVRTYMMDKEWLVAREGEAHNAPDDAIFQAKVLQAAFQNDYESRRAAQ
jgi:hypothetical protein